MADTIFEILSDDILRDSVECTLLTEAPADLYDYDIAFAALSDLNPSVPTWSVPLINDGEIKLLYIEGTVTFYPINDGVTRIVYGMIITGTFDNEFWLLGRVAFDEPIDVSHTMDELIVPFTMKVIG